MRRVFSIFEEAEGWNRYLAQLLFAEWTLWVVVKTSLQTPKTERVTARRRHRLVKQSGWEMHKHTTLLKSHVEDLFTCSLLYLTSYTENIPDLWGPRHYRPLIKTQTPLLALNRDCKSVNTKTLIIFINKFFSLVVCSPGFDFF